MILKTYLILTLSVAWEISCASFSNVYVQRGPEVNGEVKYLEYGVPSYSYVPQISQLPAAQIGSVVSLTSGYEAPCVPGPCLIPERTVATVATVPSSPNTVTYQTPIPSAPVVYSPKGKTSYEYMYSIYNQLHSERSDGAVVSGEYAFLQPDGIVRDVQYVADDVKGFNAIVKNFLPVETKPPVVVTQPCPEIKSEPLVVVQEVTFQENSDQPTEQMEQIQIAPSTEAPAQEEQTEPPSTQSPEPEVSSDDTQENIIIIAEIETTTPTEAPVEQEELAPVPTAQISVETPLISYRDVIKCIQAAMSKLNGNPTTPATPLSYIILNKPC